MVIGPLADDFVELITDWVDNRARACAHCVFALVFAFRGPTGAVMHDRAVIVRRSRGDPVGFWDPIVVRLSPWFNVFVVDRDKAVAVPALVFVKEAEDVAEFVGGHPWSLTPPK